MWEEYRGFCYGDTGHFRLDLDTVAANTKRQIIIIDNSCLLHGPRIDGFTSRLQEMMVCSLVIDSNVITSPVDAGYTDSLGDSCVDDFYERIDLFQAYWFYNGSSGMWTPNALTNPYYAFPTNYDSAGLERACDQLPFGYR